MLADKAHGLFFHGLGNPNAGILGHADFALNNADIQRLHLSDIVYGVRVQVDNRKD